MKIDWITIRVDLTDENVVVPKYSAESGYAMHPDAKHRLRLTYAEVSVMENSGGVFELDAHIYGRRITKSGEDDQRFNRNELVIGHRTLEKTVREAAFGLARSTMTQAETQV